MAERERLATDEARRRDRDANFCAFSFSPLHLPSPLHLCLARSPVPGPRLPLSAITASFTYAPPHSQIGDVGAVAGTLIYRPSLNAHFFRTPHGIAILYTGVGTLLALGLSLAMRRANVAKNAHRAARDERRGEEPRGDRKRGYLFQI